MSEMPSDYRRYALHGLALILPVVAIATATSDRLYDVSLPPVPGPNAGTASNEPSHEQPSAAAGAASEILARHQVEATALSVPERAEPTHSPVASVTPEPTPQPSSVLYSIQPGDTLASIAAAFGRSPEYILWNNPTTSSDPNLLLVGETLVIPGTDGLLYQVKLGDTLSGIALAHRVSIDSIVGYSGNGLTSPDSVIEGIVLLLPGAVPPAPPPPEPVYVAEEPVAEPAGAAVAAGVPVTTPTPTSPYGFIWPYVAPISTYFGEGGHKGLDIEGLAHYGAPVSAVAAGQVVLAIWSEWGYGNHVIIDHGGGVQTVYAHLSDIYISEGQYVTQGESIGAIGNSGYSTGPHLHFEVRVDGFFVDPLEYLP